MNFGDSRTVRDIQKDLIVAKRSSLIALEGGNREPKRQNFQRLSLQLKGPHSLKEHHSGSGSSLRPSCLHVPLRHHSAPLQHWSAWLGQRRTSGIPRKWSSLERSVFFPSCLLSHIVFLAPGRSERGSPERNMRSIVRKKGPTMVA